MLIVAGDRRDDDEVVAMSAILEHVTPVLGGWAQLVRRGSGAEGKNWSSRRRDMIQIFPSTPGKKYFKYWEW